MWQILYRNTLHATFPLSCFYHYSHLHAYPSNHAPPHPFPSYHPSSQVPLTESSLFAPYYGRTSLVTLHSTIPIIHNPPPLLSSFIYMCQPPMPIHQPSYIHSHISCPFISLSLHFSLLIKPITRLLSHHHHCHARHHNPNISTAMHHLSYLVQ